MNNNACSKLSEEHLKKLRALGLRDAIIERAGLRTITDADEGRRMLRWSPRGRTFPTPALGFPYPAVVDYVRLLPDTPRSGLAALKSAYETPLNQPPQIYRIGDFAPQESALWITTGELDTLVLAQLGYDAAGAQEVYSFHDVAARREALDRGVDTSRLHPDLLRLITPRRAVVMVFNSVMKESPALYRAAARVARMIDDAGALPELVIVPETSDQWGVGLTELAGDNADPERIKTILEQARTPTTPDAALAWLKKNRPPTNNRTELARIVRFSRFLLDAQRFARFGNRVQKEFGVSEKDFGEYSKEGDRAWGLEQTPDELGDSDWMSAGEYQVVAGGANAGVFHFGSPREGWKQVAAAAINVAEVGADETGARYATIKWRYGTEEQSKTIPREVMSGADLLTLSRFGAPVNAANRSQLQTFLQRQEQENLHQIPEVKVCTDLGWSRDLRSFVLGDLVIGDAARGAVKADAKFLAALKTGGSADEYLRSARRHVTRRRRLRCHGRPGMPRCCWCSSESEACCGRSGARRSGASQRVNALRCLRGDSPST